MTQHEPSAGGVARARLHYLDWLRVLAVAGVFVFHTLRPFDTAYWHVKNDVQSEGVSIAIGVLGSWGLAFFFLISGAGSYLALRWRSARQFAGERAIRLLIPLAVVYVLLGPVQFALEEWHHGVSSAPFGDEVLRFFRDAWEGPPLLLDNTYHLWFVVYLLEFALLGLPVFAWLRGPRGQRALGWVAEQVARRRGAALLLVVPIALIHIGLQAAPGEDHGRSEWIFYFDFFLLGHVLMADERLMRAVRRDLVPGLVLAVAGQVGLLALGAPDFLRDWWDDPAYSWPYVLIFLLLSGQAWGWIVAALNLGLRAPVFDRPLPRTVGAAAMPFFLVHQPVILAFAYVVVTWDVSAVVKYGAIFVASLLVTAAAAWALARLPVLSLLLGVKQGRKAEGAVTEAR